MTEPLPLAELKNLRRYAFCLLGNSYLSDMAVETALGALAAENGAGLNSGIYHIELYRRINEAARAGVLAGKVSATVSSGLHARLLRLDAEQRQIAALHAVIGLPFSEVASIMEMSEGHVCGIYAKSLLVLSNQPHVVLIIEDEAMIAHELQTIVTGLGLTVAGMARNRAEALRIAGVSKPHLILADYKLRGDTGVDVVKAIREILDADVIYVTAHPERVVVEKEDDDIIIAKPFNARALRLAVRTHLAA